MKKYKSDIDKFIELMQNFNIETFIEKDEYDCTEVRLKHSHHNTIPLFYFDENGKFIEVNTNMD